MLSVFVHLEEAPLQLLLLDSSLLSPAARCTEAPGLWHLPPGPWMSWHPGLMRHPELSWDELESRRIWRGRFEMERVHSLCPNCYRDLRKGDERAYDWAITSSLNSSFICAKRAQNIKSNLFQSLQQKHKGREAENPNNLAVTEQRWHLRSPSLHAASRNQANALLDR